MFALKWDNSLINLQGKAVGSESRWWTDSLRNLWNVTVATAITNFVVHFSPANSPAICCLKSKKNKFKGGKKLSAKSPFSSSILESWGEKNN